MFSRWRKFVIAPILAGLVLVPATVYGSGKLGAVLSPQGIASGVSAERGATPAAGARSTKRKPQARTVQSRPDRHRSATKAPSATKTPWAAKVTSAPKAPSVEQESLRTAATEPRPCNYLGCRGFHMLGIGF
jgi:hypothetical protein